MGLCDITPLDVPLLTTTCIYRVGDCLHELYTFNALFCSFQRNISVNTHDIGAMQKVYLEKNS